MRTVKEVSERTNISVRTLHYYDEIGLLKPTMISEAGYRLYDDKALEVLQQILFFRELDVPLKEIKVIMENPELDRNQLLSSQKKILELKKERLERIIHSIDDILKGENKMDFEIFSKEEIGQVYDAVIKNMSESARETLVKEYGSMEEFQKHFLEEMSSEQTQKNWAKVVEWYGDKDSAMEAATNPYNSEIMQAYTKRYEAVIRKLTAKRGQDVNSFEVREIVGELEFVSKQLYRMKDMSAFMLNMAEEYRTSEDIQKRMDKVYGEGSTQYIGEAVEAFYKRDRTN